MSKTKKTKGQFDHYKKWTTDEGYTFIAETKEDFDYGRYGTQFGKLREVKNEFKTNETNLNEWEGKKKEVCFTRGILRSTLQDFFDQA